MIDEDEEYGLRCTVGQLQSERDGYAGELTRMGLEVGLMRKKNTELLRTNDKLRELVRDMSKAFIHGNCYRWCEFKEPCNGECQYLDRMRELGVVE